MKNDILLDDERETDFLSKSCPQSRVEKHNRFSLIARNADFLLEDIMRDKKGRFIKGHKSTEEMRRKISLANKGHTAWNKGVPRSKETKEKLSLIHKGKRYSPNTEFKKGQIGEKAGHWKGGKTETLRGYIWILQSTHPSANHGYVSEHRFIMEKYINRYLTEDEVVHHRGVKFPIRSIENKQDNRIENLQLFVNNSEHLKFHKELRKIERGEK